VNDKAERIWKEAVGVYFRAICHYIFGETKENHDNLSIADLRTDI
jgi:hypothetical protein